MNYKITETQLDNLITNQIDIMFDVDNIHWTHPLEVNYETDEEYEDPNRIEFYKGDYGDEDTVFRWYSKEYWEPNPDNYIGYTRNSPLVEIENPYKENLNNLFGDKWYKPFKVWFKNNFDIEVKSVTDEIYNK